MCLIVNKLIFLGQFTNGIGENPLIAWLSLWAWLFLDKYCVYMLVGIILIPYENFNDICVNSWRKEELLSTFYQVYRGCVRHLKFTEIILIIIIKETYLKSIKIHRYQRFFKNWINNSISALVANNICARKDFKIHLHCSLSSLKFSDA